MEISYMDGETDQGPDERELRSHTGYVLQAIALFPNLDIAEVNIALFLRWRAGKGEKLPLLKPKNLNKVGRCCRLCPRLPSELLGVGSNSGIGIVRAIIGETKNLMMDEPFSADAISKKQLQALTKKLHKEFGMTSLIFVTHDRRCLKIRATGLQYCKKERLQVADS